MYFDRENQIEHDLGKMEAVIQHAKHTGVLFAMDSNARSAVWQDAVTNKRGKILEEFITCKQLFIVNEESSLTTFRNSLGTSNIDLTIISSHLLNCVTDWEISDQESMSDHSILTYAIKPCTAKGHAENAPTKIYKTNKDSLAKFQLNLIHIMKTKAGIIHDDNSDEDLDDTLCLQITGATDIERVDQFNEAITIACNKSFQVYNASKRVQNHRTVP
jgi:hypothetical protein